MSYVYDWKTSGGLMIVEYCFSTLDKVLKVVEMNYNGKFHRINWMGPEGREELMELLTTDYNNKVGVTN